MNNFLDPKLSPKVTSTAPATDNYEVTNLISGNLITKSRGFLAYSTVKPPVEITFELICPINVHYIVLWTTLGTQKCTAIEIAAKNCNREFTSIAYAKFNSSGIVFGNCRIYSTSNLPPNIDQNFHISFFKRNSFRSFTTANVVKICILQTERSVPCLGKIEIWGKPSKMCSVVTVNTIQRLMQGSANSSNRLVADSSDTKHKRSRDDWEIPDEFKDALTFEVMATPITLPSGNTVDQSTLEKYIANEASYGRAASDPFTGQKFTDTRKPIFNAALKSRIDMFLVQNSCRAETFTVKRTLGKAVTENVCDGPKTGAVKRKAGDSIEESSKIEVCESKQAVLSKNSSDPDDRLNEAIQKTLNSSGFMCFTKEEKTVTSTINSCVQCKNIDSLYTISCSHLYCRNCLLHVSKELKCRKCDKPFTKNDPKKFHS